MRCCAHNYFKLILKNNIKMKKKKKQIDEICHCITPMEQLTGQLKKLSGQSIEVSIEFGDRSFQFVDSTMQNTFLALHFMRLLETVENNPHMFQQGLDSISYDEVCINHKQLMTAIGVLMNVYAFEAVKDFTDEQIENSMINVIDSTIGSGGMIN